MPIRHCQLCGIKVIVDEDKASVFPFYCDLCQTKTSMKSAPPQPEIPTGDEMGMPMDPSFDDLTSPPPSVPPPPPPPSAPRITTSRQPVVPPPAPQVKCPVCLGEIPVTPASRPIKSRCPICNADLAIYPDGSVKSANEAELLKYAKTQEINVRPPTEDLKTKIREMIQEEQKTRMTPQPAPPPPRPVAKPVIPQGPKIVIKGPSAPQAPAAASQTGTRIALKPPTVKLPAPPPPPPPVAAAPMPPSLTPKPITATGKISVPPPPPPPLPPSDATEDVGGPGLILVESEEPSAPMPDAPMEPPISDDMAKPLGLQDLSAEEPASSTQATRSSMSPEQEEEEASSGLLPASKGTQRRTAPEIPKSPRSRRMPFIVVLIVLLIAPGAAGFLYMQREDPSLRRHLENLGREITASGQGLWAKLFSPKPETADPNVPPPVSKKEKRTEEELGYLKSEIAVDYDTYLKDILKTYKKSDMTTLDTDLSKVKTQSVRIQNSINQYKNMSGGKEPDLKAEFKKSLETFLTDLYMFLQSTEQNARKLTSDVATPMIQRINRAKEDYNKFLAEYESTYNAPILLDDVMDKKIKLEKMEPTPMPNPDADLLQRLNKAYREFTDSEKDFAKKGQMATEFERMLFEHNKKQYEDLKAEYEKKTGKTYEPPK